MKKLIRIGYLGSPDFSAELLRHLVLSFSHLVSVQVVWTNPPKPAGRGGKKTFTSVSLCARELGIRLIEKSVFDESDVFCIKEEEIDLLLVVAYGTILPNFFFSEPKNGSYNIHFSLLSAYRGASPIQSAILAGEEKSGITLQFISEKMDRGAIADQKIFLIKNLSTKQVFAIALEESKKMLESFFSTPLPAFSQLVAQDESTATYCKKIKKSDGRISTYDNIDLFEKKFLAYFPWPGVFFYVGEKKIDILVYSPFFLYDNGEVELFSGLLPVGSFFVDHQKRLLLVLNDGIVNIIRLKKQGKREMNADEFINGYRNFFPLCMDDI